MVRELVKDQFFLRLKSEPVTKDDMTVVEDLKDTLKAYSDECVGMSANMIGINKAVIAIQTENSKEMIVIKLYSGYIAEIIEHECDHLEGIII